MYTTKSANYVCWIFIAASHALAWSASVTNSALTAVPASYILGADDLITIRVLQAPELADKPVRIDWNGYIDLSFIGRVRAAGSTVELLKSELEAKYASIIRDPQVTVAIEEFRSQPVSIIGAVNTPGVHQIRGKKSLVEVLSLAGGLRQDAGDALKLTRRIEWGPIPLPDAKQDASGHFSVAEIDLKSLMEARDPAVNIPVEPDDVISVPKAEMVYVIGEVPKTGGFILAERKSMSLLETLTLAGGINHGTASPENSKILRLVPGSETRTEIPVNLKQVMEGKGEDIQLRGGDILFIPSSAAKRASIRAIEAAIQIGTGVVIWRH
ncbi:MAG: polysaccharide biosynthesis/export family protein [Bryobacteraceae bacterium]